MAERTRPPRLLQSRKMDSISGGSWRPFSSTARFSSLAPPSGFMARVRGVSHCKPCDVVSAFAQWRVCVMCVCLAFGLYVAAHYTKTSGRALNGLFFFFSRPKKSRKRKATNFFRHRGEGAAGPRPRLERRHSRGEGSVTPLLKSCRVEASTKRPTRHTHQARYTHDAPPTSTTNPDPLPPPRRRASCRRRRCIRARGR